MIGRLSRRALALAAALLCATLATATAALGSPSKPAGPASSLSLLERGVLADINAFRTQNHLVPLRLSASLTTAAREHSQQMAADGYFAHESADGSAFWKRIEHRYASSPWHYWSVGENLLWSSPDVDAQGALQDWLNSPEHRANLLSPNWREIGVAAVHVTAAPGMYNGLDVTIVTTDFGVRR
jgi:uncharacterized protein YkwD